MPKLKVNGSRPMASWGAMKANTEYALSHFLCLSAFPDNAVIVGAGASSYDHVKLLTNHPGPLLCSGSAIDFWLTRRPDAIFYCVDPDPLMLADQLIGRKIQRAIVAAQTDIKALQYFADIHALVEVFDSLSPPLNGAHGPTSVTMIPALSISLGYSKPIEFYGFDSSWQNGKSHAQKHCPNKWDLVVLCDGEEYETTAELVLQAEFLSAVILAMPELFVNRSAGFLAALIASKGEYDVIEASDAFVISRADDTMIAPA